MHFTTNACMHMRTHSSFTESTRVHRTEEGKATEDGKRPTWAEVTYAQVMETRMRT